MEENEILKRLDEKDRKDEILSIEIRGKKEDSVIGMGNELLLSVEGKKRREWEEGLLIGEKNIGGKEGKDERIEEKEEELIEECDEIWEIGKRVLNMRIKIGDGFLLDNREDEEEGLSEVEEIKLIEIGRKILGEIVVKEEM